MKNVIFTDLENVLFLSGGNYFDASSMTNLLSLLKEIDGKLVIIDEAWKGRDINKFYNSLRDYRFNEELLNLVIGTTTSYTEYMKGTKMKVPKGSEVLEFVHNNPALVPEKLDKKKIPITEALTRNYRLTGTDIDRGWVYEKVDYSVNYVILSNSEDFLLSQAKQLYKVDGKTGITKELVNEILNLFKSWATTGNSSQKTQVTA